MVSSRSLLPEPQQRSLLRRRLLALREQFAAGPDAAQASASLARHLHAVLSQLEPRILGVYWPIRSEFNPRWALGAEGGLSSLDRMPQISLPFARRAPAEMHYRAWNGQAPTLRDECGVPSTDGAPVTPDVVLAPCVGFTDDAFRLGYGGGYFDRWLDAHPHAVAIGVCWSVGRIDAREFAPEPHDRAMGMVVTEDGVVAD